MAPVLAHGGAQQAGGGGMCHVTSNLCCGPPNPSAVLPGTAPVRSKRCSGVQSANCRVERRRAGREGPTAPVTAFQPCGSVSIELLKCLIRQLLVPIHMEAITQPLQLVRQLYAARSEADGEDFGVKARFEAVMADPQLGAQASGFKCRATCRQALVAPMARPHNPAARPLHAGARADRGDGGAAAQPVPRAVQGHGELRRAAPAPSLPRWGHNTGQWVIAGWARRHELSRRRQRRRQRRRL